MIRLLAGDCCDILGTLPAESVHCVVTSPPYYGLRDYGTALWDGGDAACDHVRVAWQAQSFDSPHGGTGRNCQGWKGGERNQLERFRDTCGKCGAVRVDRQIGLEATPDEYLATMVGVFREIRRVLRRDGTCWVNMGDSYNNSGHACPQTSKSTINVGPKGIHAPQPWKSMHGGKPKDLLLMPARLALALQADGWWVRSDIIWHKPNPMPESVTDRPTSAHEHVFLLTRSARYYYDADAVREAHNDVNRPDGFKGADGINRPGYEPNTQAWNGGGTVMRHRDYNPAGRSCRNVWTIATSPFSAAHFATFPPELAERCIKAGTSERGCCAACGKPWVRVTERNLVPTASASYRPSDVSRGALSDGNDQGSNRARDGHLAGWMRADTTTGWSPGCDHDAPTVPCVVLDPFAGAGTTLLVADRLQRDAIGIELNTAYTEMAMERCRQDAPLFTAFPPAEPPEDERMADLFAGDEYQQMPAAVPDERRDAFRNSGRYVNQGPQPSNGASDMAAD